MKDFIFKKIAGLQSQLYSKGTLSHTVFYTSEENFYNEQSEKIFFGMIDNVSCEGQMVL